MIFTNELTWRNHRNGRHTSVYRAKLTTLVDAISDYGRLYRFKKDGPTYREIDGHRHFLKATRPDGCLAILAVLGPGQTIVAVAESTDGTREAIPFFAGVRA